MPDLAYRFKRARALGTLFVGPRVDSTARAAKESDSDVAPPSIEETTDADEHAAVLDTGATPEPPDHRERALPEPASSEARALAADLGVTITAADVLYRRGHRDVTALRGYLDPKLATLSDPEPMVDRALAADRLARAIRAGERICLFGDYDCDGITSAAIMTGVIRALGGDVTPLLASRFDGGYGVSPAAVKRILATGARVLVTCDCGSSDHAALADISASNVDIIVIDHHLVPDEPLPALAFLNPHRPDCGFAYKGLASCGLAVSVGAAVRKTLSYKLDLRPWLDLVAIGTVADVAPLDGDNRALVRAGLARIGAAGRPGVRALLELANLRGSPSITGEDVAYRIAPRINAPGRLSDPDLALQLLLARDIGGARALAAEVDQLSQQRRALQERMIEEAIEEIEREGWEERSAIVVGREGWNHGIVGIVAGNLVRRYERPVVAIGFEDGVGRGSVRGPRGSRLHDALSSVGDCLVRFGGHQAAAGLTVRLERLSDLRAGFESAVSSTGVDAIADDPGAVVWLDAADDLRRVAGDLLRLEPCGQSNPTPEVVIEGKVESAREVRGGHLKLELLLNGGASRRLAAFAPAMGDRASAIEGNTVAVVGKLRYNTFRGTSDVELLVESLRQRLPASPCVPPRPLRGRLAPRF